ncbi:hypothetical protein MMC18_001740 [Xylographa bjoerkii]|nr:hypothetical protein [Xylographa bjoerkii]
MSLGTLEQLPEEIRRLIWEHFVVPRTPASFKTPSKSSRCLFSPSKRSFSGRSERRLAVLEVSKQVHKEVTAELELYRNRTVVFKLFPDKEHIVVSNPCYLVISDFENTDFSQFETVKIMIYPPDTKDPGQLLRLRGFVEFLVNELGVSRSLAAVEIVLEETNSAHWHTNGVFNQSIPTSLPDHMVRHGDLSLDIVHLLRPFWTIRGMRDAKVILPGAAAASETVAHEARAIAAMMRTPTALRESDDSLLNHFDHTTLSLDLELDSLKGPTAAILRLRRYWDWSTYCDNITHILGRHESDVTEEFQEALEERDEARTFLDRNEFTDGSQLTYGFEEDWRSVYPAGIPAKNTFEWCEIVLNSYESKVDNKRKELGLPAPRSVMEMTAVIVMVDHATR